MWVWVCEWWVGLTLMLVVCFGCVVAFVLPDGFLLVLLDLMCCVEMASFAVLLGFRYCCVD